MKILYVNHQGKTIGGAERVMLNLASVMKEMPGVEIVPFCPEGALRDELSAMGLQVETADFVKPRRTLDPVFWAGAAASGGAVWRRLMALLRYGNYDLLFSNSYVGHLYSCLPARMSGVKNVFHMHDILKPLGVNRRAVKFASDNATGIISVSDAVKENLKGLGADASKISTVLNGIDQAGFDARAAAGLESQLPPRAQGELFVTIVGQFAYFKGQHTFVEAATKILGEQGVSLKFLVAGGMQDESEKKYIDEVKAKAEAAGDAIVFLGHRTDVPALLRESDILVHASATPDPCPLAVIEYLYAGKPVIASRIGGVPELVMDGENGLLFEPGNAAELAERIIRLARDEELRNGLAAAARDRAERRHSLRAHAEAVMKVLNGIVIK